MGDSSGGLSVCQGGQNTGDLEEVVDSSVPEVSPVYKV